MLFQNSLGVDIREDRASIAYLRTSLKGIRMAAHGTCSLEATRPVKERLKTVSEFITNFIRKQRVNATDVFIGIPSELTILRDIELPLAVKENLKSTLKYEMEKYIPLTLDDIYFDCQIIEENKADNFIRVLLVVVKKKDFEPYIEMRDQIKGGISGIETVSMGMANFLTNQIDTADKEVVVFVNTSGNRLEISVVRNSYLNYSKSVTMTEEGSSFSELITGELNTLKEIFGDESNSIKITAPGTILSNESLKQLEKETGFNPYFIDTSLIGLPSDELISAYGLALKGLKKVPMQINLLPNELRKKPNRMGYYLMFTLAVLVILSGFAWGASHVMHRRITLNRLNNEIKKLVSEVEKVEKRYASIEAIEITIDQLNTIQQNRVSALDILRELSERIPESAWVQDLNFSEKGIRINGFADSASDLIAVLEASPFFKDVVFLSTITKSKDGKERYRIGMKIK